MKKTFLVAILIVLFEIFIYIIEPIIKGNVKIITFITIVLITGVYFTYLKIKSKKCNTKHIIYLVIIIGILLRTMYIVYTPITERQHDVYGIHEQGHLGYIYTIYETGNLPKSNSIQFYHPPLFHAISAGWLKINDIFNVPLERSLEGIQIITAIFSSLMLIATYKITEELNLKDTNKIIVNSFCSFYPTFILLAGSINNDILMILLQLCIILYLIKWNKKDSYSNTIILAILTGLCVMTKLSGAIMALPILFVFIKKFLYKINHEKSQIGRLILKFLIFGIVSLPIGLWHSVRNYILFNQPIGGVLIPSDGLYIGNYSDFQRFFTISIHELFKELYCVIPGDYNVFSYIVKCSVFGEFMYNNNFSIIANTLKIINLILIVLSLISMFMYILKKNKNVFIIDLLLITWIVNIISFYSFNISYPYTCTMDFRYIVPSAFIGILLIANMLNNTNNKIIKQITNSLIMVFEILCFSMFFII